MTAIGRTCVIVIVVGLFYALPGLPGQVAHAAEDGQDRLVTTTGEAELRIPPDEVILNLGVEILDPDMQTAKSRNDAIVEAVFAVAEGYGIEPAHIQTDFINIEPRYSINEPVEILGYYVRKSIVITVRDLDIFEDVLTDSLAAGVSHVHGVQFRTTELRRHRDEARELAIQAAQEKAEALAQALGQTIGEPQQIREDQGGWWSSYGAGWGWRWGGGLSQNVVQNVGSSAPIGDSTLAPGQIAVSARVTVSFALR